MNKKRYVSIVLLILLLGFSVITVQAAAPRLNKKKIELVCGKSEKLRTNQVVTWNSSDTSVAVVNRNGKIKAVGSGSAWITAVNKKGQESVCKVVVSNYIVTKTSNRKAPRKVKVYAGDSVKNYTVYNKLAFGNAAIKSRGCSHSAVATVMSVYGMKITPQEIHLGSAKKKYSERYAWKKAEGYSSIGKKPLTVYAMAEILKNSGIKCKPVYKYQDAEAVQMITENLKSGRPVIIRVSGAEAEGVQFTRGAYHYVTLAGIDEKGHVIVLDSIGGFVNYSSYTGKYNLTVEQLVENFMAPCEGDPVASFYRNEQENNGGFILITK